MLKFFKSKQSNPTVWRTCVVLSLLLIYCLQFISAEFLHKLLHQHPEAAVVYSIKLEEDLCYRTLYHSKKNEQCGHKSHVTKKINCSFTHPSIVSKHLASEKFLPTTFTSSPDYHCIYVVIVLSARATHLPARAPPSLKIMTQSA
jgi:hypothetical protein